MTTQRKVDLGLSFIKTKIMFVNGQKNTCLKYFLQLKYTLWSMVETYTHSSYWLFSIGLKWFSLSCCDQLKFLSSHRRWTFNGIWCISGASSQLQLLRHLVFEITHSTQCKYDSSKPILELCRRGSKLTDFYLMSSEYLDFLETQCQRLQTHKNKLMLPTWASKAGNPYRYSNATPKVASTDGWQQSDGA